MKTTPISKLFKIIGGKPAPKGEGAFSDQGTPFVKMKDLGRAHFSNNLIDIEQKVSDEVVIKNGLNLIKRGSILLPRSGSVALNHRAVLGVDAYMVSHICALEVIDDTEINNLYAYYYLRTIKMDRISKKTTGLDAITFEDLGKLKIPLPHIDDQIRIAHLLSKVEGLVAQRKQHLQQLDDLLKSVFLEMFGDPVRNEKGWERKKIGDLVNEVKYGTSASAKGGVYKYLRMNNITYKGYWDFSDLKYIDIDEKDFAKYSLRKGDLVFNRTNSKELVGKTAVYDQDEPVIIAGYLIRLRVNKHNNPWYIWGHLNSKYGKTRLFNLCRNIVGMANINAQELQDIPILRAPLDLQNQFAVIVKRIETAKSCYQQSLSGLENLFGALSQQVFKGELDLSRVPLQPIAESFDTLQKIQAVPSTKETETKPTIIELPAPTDLKKLTSTEECAAVILQWLDAYLAQLGHGTSFSPTDFLAIAQQRLEELLQDKAPELSVAAYDKLKDWVFQALESGRLTQTYDDTGNSVQIIPAKG